MLKSFLSLTSILVTLSLLLNSCSKTELSKETDSFLSATSNESNPFKDLPILKQAIPGELKKVVNNSLASSQLTAQNGTSCNLIQVTKTADFAEQILLDPITDLMYLGSVINANSLSDGSYQPVTPITTNNITISLNLQGVQGSLQRVIKPELASYRQALNDILNASITGEQASEMTYTVNQIYSEDQLKIAIGGSFGLGKLADIKASYNFNSTDNKTRVVAKFVQKYFTAEMNIPQGGSFVTSLPSSTTISPVYVSSFQYGRMGLFFMESSASSSQLTASINTTINFVFGKSTIEASTEQKNIINNSTIKVYITGGSGSTAVQSIQGYDGFVNYITQGGKFSSDSRGAILSYKLRNLSNNAVYSVSLTSTYNVKDCSNMVVPIYSLYHDGVKDHVYSPDPNAQAQWPGWTNHGVSFRAYSAQVEGSVPIYTIYHNGIKDHVYSPNPNAQAQWPGWVTYGPAFYAFTSQVEGTVPVYSLYANSITDHVYSTNPNAQAQWPGWVNYGVAFYAFPN